MYGLILIGMPCSGKSSIGKRLAKSYGYDYISSGDIAREMAENNKSIKDDLNSGRMAPEYMMRSAVRTRILRDRDDNMNFILDGFPRFIDQSRWLYETFGDIAFITVHVHISEYEALNRGIKRGREDDTSLMDRIKYYKSVTYPLALDADIMIENNKDNDSAAELIYLEVMKRVNNRKPN